jgi:hypothetical protein
MLWCSVAAFGFFVSVSSQAKTVGERVAAEGPLSVYRRSADGTGQDGLHLGRPRNNYTNDLSCFRKMLVSYS